LSETPDSEELRFEFSGERDCGLNFLGLFLWENGLPRSGEENISPKLIEFLTDLKLS